MTHYILKNTIQSASSLDQGQRTTIWELELHRGEKLEREIWEGLGGRKVNSGTSWWRVCRVEEVCEVTLEPGRCEIAVWLITGSAGFRIKWLRMRIVCEEIERDKVLVNEVHRIMGAGHAVANEIEKVGNKDYHWAKVWRECWRRWVNVIIIFLSIIT